MKIVESIRVRNGENGLHAIDLILTRNFTEKYMRSTRERTNNAITLTRLFNTLSNYEEYGSYDFEIDFEGGLLRIELSNYVYGLDPRLSDELQDVLQKFYDNVYGERENFVDFLVEN